MSSARRCIHGALLRDAPLFGREQVVEGMPRTVRNA